MCKMRLLKNIYQVGGPSISHFFDAAAYLLKMKEGYVLIDCGTPEGYEIIKNNIEKLGVNLHEIKYILGTHGHYDHIGAAHLWNQEFGCKLYLHEADCKQVEQGDSDKTSAALLYGTKSVPYKVDGIIQEGDNWQGDGFLIEAFHTLGHTKGSVCFDITLDEYHLLVAGDSVWGGYSEKIGSDEKAWIQSLEKITSRHFDFYTFGHVNPQLIADADARLKEAKMAFGNYYNPWFKTFFETYHY